VDALQRLLDGRGFTSQVALDALLDYPALLALRTMSIVTIDEGRDDFLIELLTHPRWTDPYGRRGPANAAEVLHINRALDGDMINKLPRWEGKVRWLYPQSHFLKTVLQEVVTENGVESTRYEQLCDDVEYRTGLVQLLTAAGTPRPNMGEVADERNWDATEAPRREPLPRPPHQGGEDAWTPLLGGDSLNDVLERYREILKTYIRY
jgi:hypothetical protein